MSLRQMLASPINQALRPLRVQLVAGTSADPAIASFLPARKTHAAARKAGLSVGDYLDRTYARPGTTADAVRAMISIAELQTCPHVCEIGPGSGRYAQQVIDTLHPQAYEIYETARDWLPSLRRLPNVVVRNANGHTLDQTPDASVDLVHCHKLFVYAEFFAVAGYLDEMARVVRPGGVVAFDLVTEECLDDPTVLEWARRGTIFRPIPRTWTVNFLERQQLTLLGSHIEPLPDGSTELLVFRRASAS